MVILASANMRLYLTWVRNYLYRPIVHEINTSNLQFDKKNDDDGTYSCLLRNNTLRTMRTDRQTDRPKCEPKSHPMDLFIIFSENVTGG